MSSQQRGYDQALLDEAPVATRAQRQEGYNVDLLDDRPHRPLSTQPLSPPPPIDTDVENGSQEKLPPTTSTFPKKPAQSFWRTRNGIIIIFVIVILVVGGVIGGAVGGTAKNNATPPPPSDNSTSSSSSTSSDTQQTSTFPAMTPPGIVSVSTTSTSPIVQVSAKSTSSLGIAGSGTTASPAQGFVAAIVSPMATQGLSNGITGDS